MTSDIPTEQQIASASTVTLFEWLEALTLRLGFCIETGLREGSIELATALQTILRRVDTEGLSDPREPTEGVLVP